VAKWAGRTSEPAPVAVAKLHRNHFSLFFRRSTRTDFPGVLFRGPTLTDPALPGPVAAGAEPRPPVEGSARPSSKAGGVEGRAWGIRTEDDGPKPSPGLPKQVPTKPAILPCQKTKRKRVRGTTRPEDGPASSKRGHTAARNQGGAQAPASATLTRTAADQQVGPGRQAQPNLPQKEGGRSKKTVADEGKKTANHTVARHSNS